MRAIHDQQQERRGELTEAQQDLASRESDLIALHRDLEEQRKEVQAAIDAMRALQGEREQLRERQLDLEVQRDALRDLDELLDSLFDKLND